MRTITTALAAAALAALPVASFAETPSFEAGAENQVTAGVFARVRWGAEDQDKTEGLTYGLALRADMACATGCAPNTRALELRAGETPSVWLAAQSRELRLDGDEDTSHRGAQIQAIALYAVGAVIIVAGGAAVLDMIEDDEDPETAPE